MHGPLQNVSSEVHGVIALIQNVDDLAAVWFKVIDVTRNSASDVPYKS
jgi:hypothetical protein